MWRPKLVVPALSRLRQKDPKFEASLDYMVRSYVKTLKEKKLVSNTILNFPVRDKM